MPAERPAIWSRAQRRLHGWNAALVLLAFPLAWIMVAVPVQELLAKFLLYQLHKSLGIAAFLIVLVRLVYLLRRPRPAWREGLARWQRRAAPVMHAALYVLLVVTPLLGYLTAATAPAGVPTLFLLVIPVPHIVGTDADWFAVLRQAHRAAAILLVALAAGHATMALRHWWRDRMDTRLRRAAA
jgi:cytochrome b561